MKNLSFMDFSHCAPCPIVFFMLIYVLVVNLVLRGCYMGTFLLLAGGLFVIIAVVVVVASVSSVIGAVAAEEADVED